MRFMRRSMIFVAMVVPVSLLSITARATTPSPPVVQTAVAAPGPKGPLAGTMLSPGRGVPVVLMIPGSGPTDRDGNSPLGLKAATLRLLAEGLATRGITTVRIDKRGMYASAGAIPDANAVTIGDYATDVHSWIASIRPMTGARCVWVLGHSEGGLVALSAAQDSTDICGLILLATPGRPTDQTLAEQLRANPANAPVLDQALAAIANLKAGRHIDVSQFHPALQRLFHPAIQDFLISEFTIDPAKLLSTIHKPVLIVQGERDMQVSVADAHVLKQADPAAKSIMLPDTNHVLKPVTSADRRVNLATYANPDLPLVPAVVPAIADFVLSASR